MSRREPSSFNEAFEWIALNEVRSSLTPRQSHRALEHLLGQLETMCVEMEMPLLSSYEVRNALAMSLKAVTGNA